MKSYRELIPLTLTTLLKNFFSIVRGFTIVSKDYTGRRLKYPSHRTTDLHIQAIGLNLIYV